jgi:hypothetical protein
MTPAQARKVTPGSYIQDQVGHDHRVESIQPAALYPGHFYFKCTDGSRILSMDVQV